MKLKYPANKLIKIVSCKPNHTTKTLDITVKLTKFAQDFIELMEWYKERK